MSLKSNEASVGRGWLLGVVLFALTIASYLLAITRGGFIWDDNDYLTENALVQRADGLETIWFQPTKLPQYYPVVFTMFWAEYRLWGLQPMGYHLVNVLLHAASVLMVWRILVRLRIKGAILAAALFAVHPVMVESVAWVTERKNVAAGAFYLAAMLAYLRFVMPEETHGEKRDWGWYGLAIILFALALLSKSVACSFPVAVLILLWYQRGRITWKDVGLLAPFLALGAIAGLNTAMLERTRVGAIGSDWAFSWMERVLIAGRATWFYPWKVVAPVNLTFIYPRWAIDDGKWWQWLFPAGAIMVVAGSLAGVRRLGRGPAAAILFFGVTIFPALGLANIFPMKFTFVADHYQYMASLGLLVLIAAALTKVGENLAPRMRMVLGGALIMGLAMMTATQCFIYHNERTLWMDTIAKNPAAYPGYDNLGIMETRAGDFTMALTYLKKSQALKPTNHVEVYMALGDWYFKQGRYAEAIAPLKEALRQEGDPYFKALATNMLGSLAVQQKDYAKAVRWFEISTEYFPAFEEAWLNLQQAEILAGNFEKSRAAGEEVLRLDHGN